MHITNIMIFLRSDIYKQYTDYTNTFMSIYKQNILQQLVF